MAQQQEMEIDYYCLNCGKKLAGKHEVEPHMRSHMEAPARGHVRMSRLQSR